MKRLFQKTNVLVAAALMAATALAQQSPLPVDPLEPAEPAAPQYRVEVIVFAYNDADPTEESFRPRPVRSTSNETLLPGVPPDLEDFDLESLTNLNDPAVARRLNSQDAPSPEGAPGSQEGDAPLDATGAPTPSAGSLPGASSSAGTTPTGEQADSVPSPAVSASEDRTGPGATAFRFRILESDELQLKNAYSRLERLDAYTPLLHGGWIQDGLPENAARPFDIAYLGTFNPAGTIRLHVSRFLHLTVDLEYRPTPLQRAAGFSGEPAPFGLSELSLAPRHVLATSRRLRSGEINYFDHPYFGLIVVVTPYEPTPETPAEGVGPAA